MNERGRKGGVSWIWVQRRDTHTHTNVFQGVSDNGSRNEGNLKVLEEVRRLPERADPADLWDLAQ